MGYYRIFGVTIRKLLIQLVTTCMHVNACAWEYQKEALNGMELELRLVVRRQNTFDSQVCWEPNLVPLQWQLVLLTIELSLQPLNILLYFLIAIQREKCDYNSFLHQLHKVFGNSTNKNPECF